MCVCDPAVRDGWEYIRWAAEVFGDCVYTPRDRIGFFVGLSSILCWLPCQIPQLYTNFKNKNADALSPYFLLIWLLGDSLNMIGCILTGQLPTQTATAVYFVMCDVLTVSQYIYYYIVNYVIKQKSNDEFVNIKHSFQPPSYGATSTSTPASTTTVARSVAAGLMGFTGVLQIYTYMGPGPVGHHSSSTASHGSGRILLSKIEEICGASPPEEWAVKLGLFIGWASCVLYLSSRLPQIYKNYNRKSTDGLAFYMFLSAVMGNLTYAASIFIRSTDPAVLAGQVPWILGAVGTLGLDFTVFAQFLLYKDQSGASGYQPIPVEDSKI